MKKLLTFFIVATFIMVACEKEPIQVSMPNYVEQLSLLEKQMALVSDSLSKYGSNYAGFQRTLAALTDNVHSLHETFFSFNQAEQLKYISELQQDFWRINSGIEELKISYATMADLVKKQSEENSTNNEDLKLALANHKSQLESKIQAIQDSVEELAGNIQNGPSDVDITAWIDEWFKNKFDLINKQFKNNLDSISNEFNNRLDAIKSNYKIKILDSKITSADDGKFKEIKITTVTNQGGRIYWSGGHILDAERDRYLKSSLFGGSNVSGSIDFSSLQSPRFTRDEILIIQFQPSAININDYSFSIINSNGEKLSNITVSCEERDDLITRNSTGIYNLRISLINRGSDGVQRFIFEAGNNIYAIQAEKKNDLERIISDFEIIFKNHYGYMNVYYSYQEIKESKDVARFSGTTFTISNDKVSSSQENLPPVDIFCFENSSNALWITAADQLKISYPYNFMNNFTLYPGEHLEFELTGLMKDAYLWYVDVLDNKDGTRYEDINDQFTGVNVIKSCTEKIDISIKRNSNASETEKINALYRIHVINYNGTYTDVGYTGFVLPIEVQKK
ncbi:hypothetical protein EZS27_029038 [termite gut metagenome]|uniref:Uncharacterized protein n=1 Tax=termite gut metagenome TaxID=433724 RepID=A0A5J4QIZ7_9ZZZZ